MTMLNEVFPFVATFILGFCIGARVVLVWTETKLEQYVALACFLKEHLGWCLPTREKNRRCYAGKAGDAVYTVDLAGRKPVLNVTQVRGATDTPPCTPPHYQTLKEEVDSCP